MAIDSIHQATFRRGSTTYFNSSLFFPKAVREDVFVLYGFVRVADDFVDAVPQDVAGFRDFRARYDRALAGTKANDPIIDAYVDLAARKRFDPAWTDAFLASMAMDLEKSEYDTLDDVLAYIYGSAEVIGLFMCRIMGTVEEALPYAQLLGRSMQYINFIRDIKEDLLLGRRYLPLAGSGLSSLDESYVRANRDEFVAFHRKQIAIYEAWQREAEKGYRYLPRRFRAPIRTAADMYLWTAKQIGKNPLVVYERKVKPKKSRIVRRLLRNLVFG